MGPAIEACVCGAGPAGLATALYLNRLGHRVTILERFATPRPLGSGLILQPTGLAVLHELGLFDAILARGAPLDRLGGTDARTGRRVLDVRYAALGNGKRGLGVHRSALFDVLFDAVRAAGIQIETATEVSDLEGRHVLAGNRRLGAFGLVIDCLGANSPLRRHARSRDRTRPLAWGALWATLPWVEAGFDRRALLQCYVGAGVMIGVLPVGRPVSDGAESAAFFWSVRNDRRDALVARGRDAWKSEVANLWPVTAPHLNAISSFDDLSFARYAHHTLGTPAGEGIAFVGDSAHSTSPQLGQGANMALLDARALFVALRDNATIEDALATYCRLRRWHVRFYQFLSLALTPFYQSDSRVLPALRDLVVADLSRIPPAPKLLAAMVAGVLLDPLKRLTLDPPPAF